jgi:hypothetical protein
MRFLALACITIVGHLLVVGILATGMTDKGATERDFIAYWSAGQQLAHGANPYDSRGIHLLEHGAGLSDDQNLRIMRNPPDAFFLVLPLGFVGPTPGILLWLLALLASVSVSVGLLWTLNGRPDNYFHFLGYAFLPVITCFKAGQVGIFLLLGISLFASLHRSRPFFAGTALLLCAIKPHLFLPFGLVLILWTAVHRQFRILAGFCVALAASCALSYHLDPPAWSQFSDLLRTGGVFDEPVPALSVYMRLLIDPHTVWLEFIPVTLACGWAVWYFWTRKDRWDWLDHGMLLLLVSVLCAPYSWLTDESVLLSAVLFGLYRAAEAGRSLVPLWIIGSAGLIETISNVQLTTPYFLWTAPAWLGWYLYATGRIGIPKGRRSGEAVVAN